MNRLAFRLGSTSYVYPADILTNVKRLAALVDDIQLLLYQADSINELLDKDTLTTLKQLAYNNALTYTVHLPLDLKLGNEDYNIRIQSIKKIQKVIEKVKVLNPFAYTIHLNANSTNDWNLWQKYCIESLKYIANICGGPQMLTIENMPDYAIERLDPILNDYLFGFCLDVGHIWSHKQDPIPYFKKWKDCIRVIHLHGVQKRDHASIEHIPRKEIYNLLDIISKHNFSGVITLELFSEKDFFISKKIIDEWLLL